jgi:type 1 glutamine amidotransferase
VQRVICIAIMTALMTSAFGLTGMAAQIPDEARKKIEAALPDECYAPPQQPRKLLVFTLCKGFRHSVIPLGAEAMRRLGEKSGAFEATVSDDIAMFEPQQLSSFDGVLFFNTTGELFMPGDPEKLSPVEREEAPKRDARLKENLLDFVKGGKGVIGVHAATDCFYEWSDYGLMMGGYFDGHPWHEEIVIKLDEPDHPLNAPCHGKPLILTDEIYQFRDPYSRERLRVLLSLDTDRTNMSKPGIRRTDGDFAVSWVRPYGKGRVFYCSLGHRDEIFWNPAVLRHYLAGIQFALGDLKADAAPSTVPSKHSWRPLFNGKDLTGWKAVVGDPVSRHEMGSEELARAQASADEGMRAHWTVRDGILTFDGTGESISTVEEFGDFELSLEWKIEAAGDGGIYLRGTPQVQIWDAQQNIEGSGGLYNNQHCPSKPLVRADRPVGEWNSFHIRMIGPEVSVYLNNVLVVDRVPLENYWEREKSIYATGPIELQAHQTPLWFRNIMIREISPEQVAVRRVRGTWRELFDGQSLKGWTCKDGSWVVEEGALARRGGGDIWTAERFGDFILELEFKLAPDTNSGLFFRAADLRDPVQTGIEMQILDSYGKDEVGSHDCGAIYDCLAPGKNVVLPAGEWNHVVLTCNDSLITVVMNGDRIIDMDLDQWTEPHRNPDGSPNKFRTAYKEMPRRGHLGFQDHGKPVWYRNIRIKVLD